MPDSSSVVLGPKLGQVEYCDVGGNITNSLRAFLRAFDALVQASVLNATTATPPGSPADGDAYIVAASPTGAWAGQAGNLAVWSAEIATTDTNTKVPAWEFHAPKAGWLVYNVATSSFYLYSGSAWAVFSGGGGGTNYQTVQQAGSSKTQEAKLNFLAPVTAADNSGNGSTDVTVPNMVGDSGSGGTAGLVPAAPSGSAAAGKYLKADGTFATPPGTGPTAFTGLSDVPSAYTSDGGYAVEVNSGATALVFNKKPFDVSVFAPGPGTASQKLLRIKLARAVTFPASATLSQAAASAAATASTTFTLYKNGTSFATVNYAASASSGTWTQASDAVFAAGDLLEIDGPATADTTLADVGITLAGVRA